MSLLLKNSSPAERKRGCTFSDYFRSEALVTANGGSITGSPSFSMQKGVTLDGSSDYLTYDLCGTEFDSDPISIAIEFTPDFNYDEDAIRYFFGGRTGAVDYYLYRHNAAGSSVLMLTLGDTFIGSVSTSEYSAYWLQGQRNVIVIAATSSDTDVYLNGNHVRNFNTGWTEDPMDNMNFGANWAGSSTFDGTIHSVRVFKAKLTAKEAQDFYDETVYDYERYMTEFPLTYAHHGATVNDNTGAYQMVINGAPVKLARRGYSFDGAADYLSRADDGSFDMDLVNNPGGDFSIQCVVTPHDITTNDSILAKWTGAGNQRAWRLRNNTGNTTFDISDDGTNAGGALTSIAAAASLAAHRPAFITATYHWVTDGTSEMRIYVDNLATATSNIANGPVFNSTSAFEIGATDGGFNTFSGLIHDCCVYKGIALTELQHLDYMMRMKKQLQDI